MKNLPGVTTMPNEKILLVDDEPDLVTTVQFFLESNEYQVVTAANGEEAIQKTVAEKPDLILMDIMMPKMDGLTACRILKSNENTKNIPIIMVTAKGNREDVAQAARAKANSYIMKPFNLITLVDKIHEVFNHPEFFLVERA
jgi:CheY-like chemotaxis protein